MGASTTDPDVILPVLPGWLVGAIGKERKGMRASLLLLSATLILAACYALVKARDPRRKHLPPKVPGLPIINQTWWHMQDNLSLNTRKWAQEYGEIFRTRCGTTDWIWLSSREAVKDVIDRQSALSSNRLLTPMTSQTASGGRRMVFMQYSPKWRTIKSIMHRLLMATSAKSYQPIQEFEAKQLSVDLLDDPRSELPFPSPRLPSRGVVGDEERLAS